MGDLPPLTDPAIAAHARQVSSDWTDWDGPNPNGAFQFPLEETMHVPSFRDSKRALLDYLAENPERVSEFSIAALRSLATPNFGPGAAVAAAAVAAHEGRSTTSNEPPHKWTRTDDGTFQASIQPSAVDNASQSMSSAFQPAAATITATADTTSATTEVARPQTPASQTGPNAPTASLHRAGHASRGSRSSRNPRSTSHPNHGPGNSGFVDPMMLNNGGPGPSVPNSPALSAARTSGGLAPIWSDAQIAQFTGRDPNVEPLGSPMAVTHERGQSSSSGQGQPQSQPQHQPQSRPQSQGQGQGQLAAAPFETPSTAEMFQATAAMVDVIIASSSSAAAGAPQSTAAVTNAMTAPDFGIPQAAAANATAPISAGPLIPNMAAAGTNVNAPMSQGSAIALPAYPTSNPPMTNDPNGPSHVADASLGADDSSNEPLTVHTLPSVYMKALGDQADIYVKTCNDLADRITSALESLTRQTSNAPNVYKYCNRLPSRSVAEKEWNIYRGQLRNLYACVREHMWAALLGIIRGLMVFFRRFGSCLDPERHGNRDVLFHRIQRMKFEIVNYRFPEWETYLVEDMRASAAAHYQQQAQPTSTYTVNPMLPNFHF